jgi:hypothetical protein
MIIRLREVLAKTVLHKKTGYRQMPSFFMVDLLPMLAASAL